MAGTDLQTLLNTIQHLEQTGRLVEAEQKYLQLLALRPNLTDTWYNLARLQRHLGKFDAALASYQQALDRGVSQPEEVHLNRGVIYSDALKRFDLAERELRAALALNANYVPALFNLANLNEDFGRRDAAVALYQRILALEPSHYEALARYASLSQAKNADDPVIRKLQHALAGSDASDADKASLGFALGRMLDECAAYDEAFAAYTAANRHSRATSPRDAVLYDRKAHERFIDDLIATFAQPIPAAPNRDTPRPIFICGMFRSGSTLTEQVLAAHTQVKGGGELAFLPTLVERELAPFPASMRSLDPVRVRQLAQIYRDGLSQLFPAATHVTDKRPDNFLFIGLIKQLFPDAKIVHTTRNALDNCLSIFFLHLDHRMGYALDLMDIGHYYSQYRRLMAHWRSIYADDILDFDYDNFVREPRSATQRLLAFCELEWQEGCLAFHQASNAVRTASVWQVRKPVYQQSSGRWHHYARHIEGLRTYLHDVGVDDSG